MSSSIVKTAKKRDSKFTVPFSGLSKKKRCFCRNSRFPIYAGQPVAGPLEDTFPENQFRAHKKSGPTKKKKTSFCRLEPFWVTVRGPPNSQLEDHRASLKMRRECGPWTGSLVGPEPVFKLGHFWLFLLPSFCLKPYFYSVCVQIPI